MYKCLCVCICVCMYYCVSLCIYIYTSVCVCVYLYMIVCVCVCVFVKCEVWGRALHKGLYVPSHQEALRWHVMYQNKVAAPLMKNQRSDRRPLSMMKQHILLSIKVLLKLPGHIWQHGSTQRSGPAIMRTYLQIIHSDLEIHKNINTCIKE